MEEYTMQQKCTHTIHTYDKLAYVEYIVCINFLTVNARPLKDVITNHRKPISRAADFHVRNPLEADVSPTQYSLIHIYTCVLWSTYNLCITYTFVHTCMCYLYYNLVVFFLFFLSIL